MRELLARAQALPAQARAAAAGEVGRLRLAFVSTVGFELLPHWLRAFRARHPQVALELVEATGDVQLRGLARGEIDAGFMLHSPGFAPPGLARLARGARAAGAGAAASSIRWPRAARCRWPRCWPSRW